MTDIDYNDVTQLSDEYLRERIKINKHGAEHYSALVKNLLDGVAEDQAEIDRRELEAYWLANPEMEPVRVGDKVMLYEPLYPAEIASIDIKSETGVIRWWVFDKTLNPHYWVDMSMSKMQALRRAYLQAESGEPR